MAENSQKITKIAKFSIFEKFQDFPVTQILREINFGESKSPKSAFLAISRFSCHSDFA